jgi:hypothetical protein
MSTATAPSASLFQIAHAYTVLHDGELIPVTMI